MSTVNKQILLGNLGKDPETIHFENGGQVTKFTLATTETYINRDSGEKISNTEWHNIVTKGKTAENANKYLRKGSKVYLEGRTKHRSYEKDGQTKYITEVHVSVLTFLSTQNNNNQTSQNTNAEEENDDLPF